MDGKQIMQQLSVVNKSGDNQDSMAQSMNEGGSLVESALEQTKNSTNLIKFIDSNGCPTDANLMGPLVRMDPAGHRLLAPFDAFKFPTSDVVFFRAVVSNCVADCKPAMCKDGGDSVPALEKERPEQTIQLTQSTSGGIDADSRASSNPPSALATTTPTKANNRFFGQQRTTTPTFSGASQSTSSGHLSSRTIPFVTMAPLPATVATVSTTKTDNNHSILSSTAAPPLPSTTIEHSPTKGATDLMTTIPGFEHAANEQARPESNTSISSNDTANLVDDSITNNHSGKILPRPSTETDNYPNESKESDKLPLLERVSSLSKEQMQHIAGFFANEIEQQIYLPNGNRNRTEMAQMYANFLDSMLTQNSSQPGSTSGSAANHKTGIGATTQGQDVGHENIRDNEPQHQITASGGTKSMPTEQVGETSGSALLGLVDVFAKIKSPAALDAVANQMAEMDQLPAQQKPMMSNAESTSNHSTRLHNDGRDNEHSNVNQSQNQIPISSHKPLVSSGFSSSKLATDSDDGPDDKKQLKMNLRSKIRRLVWYVLMHTFGQTTSSHNAEGKSPVSRPEVVQTSNSRSKRSLRRDEGMLGPGYVVEEQSQVMNYKLVGLVREHSPDYQPLVFTKATVKMYHTDRKPPPIRAKRDVPAAPVYDLGGGEELFVQSIKVVDRIQFEHDKSVDLSRHQANNKPAILRTRKNDALSPTNSHYESSIRARTISSTTRNADTTYDEQQLPPIGSRLSATGLIMISLCFVFVQISVVLVCLVDWDTKWRFSKQKRTTVSNDDTWSKSSTFSSPGLYSDHFSGLSSSLDTTSPCSKPPNNTLALLYFKEFEPINGEHEPTKSLNGRDHFQSIYSDSPSRGPSSGGRRGLRQQRPELLLPISHLHQKGKFGAQE